MSFAAMMLVALALDLVLGWPKALYDRIGHPVTWLGALIVALERRWNTNGPLRRARGLAVAVLVVGLAGLVGLALQFALPANWIGIALGGVLAWPLVAMRSMHEHVAAVLHPLQRGDLPAARHAVSMIVGRDPALLDEPGVARAALESLAENTSDGIVAPVVWGALLGLPGIAAYKAINTLDSMIGHKNARYLEFGWASARIDDLANLLPARLTGLIFALVSGRFRASLACMWRDAGHHRSPNAGWPEAAMAGALEVKLSGPRAYGTDLVQEPWVNADANNPEANDLRRGLHLYARSMVFLAIALTGVAIWAI
ncbi:adenosylcobinamide-phosphate synthase CbiB [Roseinatronobacter bogoriensis]|uniref:Cobalamin biosynthesis protein CobD n=1 Tax=Roseinatronobacter bogoriensis subsp. barguzinensis TaxID=441209 RepID=A0A2K8KD88_9RHOB|nr:MULTISPECIES: adenosylcobinamide-phosphate synthase CbiB [Rhodobaca]ATX67394.1 cobalamin biosynthesis protein CobD [Rhodobaca barguzinensis]MBB4206968.1 adenosylcobinamide-phosphate synthase [Rhodobaca bogoriensis DSM 18756]TDW41711.1 adenosylcobinamide-phosphate synthase [Rhodobaca barguzinensis]TDY74110.1 adenosylcobinamide-phosphate synthase [Rhodobaca bogoriensis DSM 18756]